MQKKELLLLVTFIIGFVTFCEAQHQRYAIRNGLGIYGGLTQFDISTDNFATESEQGWIGGMAATVDLPHKWYTVSYNIQLSQNYFSVLGNPDNLNDVLLMERVKYKLFTTQIAFVFHLKLIEDYVTLDFAPMLQYNSNLEVDNENQESHFLNKYNNLRAEDITDISRFNINAAAGLTAGFKNFKLRGQYIYGVTNILGRLNDNDLDTSGGSNSFKGNMNMIALTAMIYF